MAQARPKIWTRRRTSLVMEGRGNSEELVAGEATPPPPTGRMAPVLGSRSNVCISRIWTSLSLSRPSF